MLARLWDAKKADVTLLQIGPLCLAALSQTATKLKYLYLSEELSPSSFGDSRLIPLLKASISAPRT